jgi:hypothetical protein
MNKARRRGRGAIDRIRAANAKPTVPAQRPDCMPNAANGLKKQPE